MSHQPVVVSLNHVAKGFKVYPSHWARLKEWLWPMKPNHSVHWLYKDISFNVKRGEAIGLVGVNGAGKSTLLKMIVGTSSCTAGNITVDGSVAAILELGMGFQNEFTGRQNAIMAGQLMGHSSAAMDSVIEDIKAFSEIDDYFEQPIRTYSSGMKMRLAFAVVTAFRPDVLIIDEALSVGDSYFKHKSFAKIKEFKDRGTSMIIVSHDRGAIQALCEKAVLIHEGVVEKFDSAEYVMDYYHALIAAKENQLISQTQLSDGRVQTVSGSGEVSIVDVSLHDSSEHVTTDRFEVGTEVDLKISIEVNKDVVSLVAGFMIKDRFGQPVYGTNTEYSNQKLYDLRAGSSLDLSYRFKLSLGEGSYSIAVALSKSQSHLEGNYEWRDLATIFSIVNTSQNKFTGMVHLTPTLAISNLDNEG